MTWAPALKSTSRHFIAKNLLDFIEDNQAEALAWARDALGYTGQVANFKAIFNSSAGRVVTQWPNLMLTRAGTAEPNLESEDGLRVEQVHDFEFEIAVTHSDPDTLTHLAEVYLVAVDSMLRNVPAATLAAGVSGAALVSCDVIGVDRDQTRLGQSIYLQAPKVRARVQMWEVG